MAVLRELLAKVRIQVTGKADLVDTQTRLRAARQAAVDARAALGRISANVNPLPLQQVQTQLTGLRRVAADLRARLGFTASPRVDTSAIQSQLQGVNRAATEARTNLGSLSASVNPAPLRQVASELTGIRRVAANLRASLGFTATPRLDTSVIRSQVRELRQTAASARRDVEQLRLVGAEQARIARARVATAAKGVATAATPEARATATTALQQATADRDRQAAAAKAQLTAATQRQAAAEAQLTQLLGRVRAATDAASRSNRTFAARIRAATAATRQYITGARGASTATKSWASSVFTLGNAFKGLAIVAVAQQIGSFFSTTLKDADNIGKMAKQLNISTDDLQVWSQWAVEAGVRQEEVVTSMRALGRNAFEATRSLSGPAAEAFRRLNVEVQGTDGSLKDLNSLLLETGNALESHGNDTERVAFAQALLGRAGLKLLPGFKGGADAVAEQMTRLRQLAIVYDKDFIANVEKANDKMALLGLQFKRFRAQAINFFLPILQGIGDTMTPLLNQFSKWIKTTQAVNAVFALLAAKLAQLGLSKLLSRLRATGGILRGLVRLVWRFILPFLIFDDILVFLRGGDSVLGAILDKLAGEGAAEGVLENIRAGAEFARASLELLWSAMTGEPISDETHDSLFEFNDAIQRVTEDIKFAWNDLMFFLDSQITLFVEGASLIWADFGRSLVDTIAFMGVPIASLFTALWLFITEGASAAALSLVESFIGPPDEILANFQSLWEGLEAGWMTTIDFISGLLSGLLDTIGTVVDSAVAAGSAVAAAATGDFSGALEFARQAVTGEAPAVAPTVGGATDNRSVVVNDNRTINSTVNTAASTPTAVAGVAARTANTLAASQLGRTPAAVARQAF